MRRSNRKIITALIVIAIILIVIITGIILYLTTDMFKSNKELFYKYALENVLEVSKYTPKEEELDIRKGKNKTNGTITFDMTTNNSNIANTTIPARNFNVIFDKQSDPTIKRDNSKITLRYLDNNIINIDYLRNNDIYGIKSDEVINKYLAFSNNNLKQMAQNYGITDVTYIPDKIEFTNYEELLKIDESDINYIIQNYADIIANEIGNENYYKSKKTITKLNNETIEATCYGVKLSSYTIANIEEQVLNRVMQDDELLAKILEKIKLIYPNENITVENLKNEIKNLINNVKNTQNNEETIEIELYQAKGEIIKTIIKLENKDNIKVYTVDYQTSGNSSRMVISYDDTEDKTKKVECKNIEIAKQVQGTQTNNVIVLTLLANDNKEYKISFQNKEDKDLSSMQISNEKVIVVNIADETSIVAKINSVTKKEDNVSIEELTKQNSAIINEFTPDYMMNLANAISNRVQVLFGKKIEEIKSLQTQQTIIDVNNNETQNSSEQSNAKSNTIIQGQNNVIL